MAAIQTEQAIRYLQENADKLLNPIGFERWDCSEACKIMYLTGCRISDALNCEMWDYSENQPTGYTAQKNGNYCTISNTEDDQALKIACISLSQRDLKPSYEDVVRYIKRRQIHAIGKGKKNSLSCHQFRHLYVQKLHANGVAATLIAAKIGDTLQRTIGYIESQYTI